MSPLESIEKNIYAPLEIQGFLKGKNGENDPFGDYFKGSYNQDDKSNSMESTLKILNSYCKAQGRTDDVTYWDGQVREMMEMVKRFRETLPVRTKVDNVFNFCDEEMGDSKLPETEEEIKASMAEIAKMDAILKIKQAEEKKAKLDTIQSEEESRNILARMECFERTTGIRNNFEEFMRLLNENENTESSSILLPLPQVEGIVREVLEEGDNKKEGEKEESKKEKEDKKGEEKKKEKEQKKENQGSKLQKINSKFVERNIKLAKCGRGTLSVTDEEKSRLEDLLGESESSSKVAEESKEPSIESMEDTFTPEEECFGIDCDIQSALNKIDEQLEVLRSKRTSSVCSISFLEKVKSEEKMSDEEEKQSRRKRREKTPERLEKINKQLQLMNSISREEIRPLSEKELANLIKQSKRGLGDWKKVEEKPEDSKSENSKTHEEIIAELVSNAKTLMPKFKYRFGKS